MADVIDQVALLRAENDALRAQADHQALHLDESVEALRLHAERHAEEVGDLALERASARDRPARAGDQAAVRGAVADPVGSAGVRR